jgi:hypothetical protein
MSFFTVFQRFAGGGSGRPANEKGLSFGGEYEQLADQIASYTLSKDNVEFYFDRKIVEPNMDEFKAHKRKI